MLFKSLILTLFQLFTSNTISGESKLFLISYISQPTEYSVNTLLVSQYSVTTQTVLSRVAYIMKKCPIWKCLDFPDLWFDVKRWNKVKISDLKKIYREQLTKENNEFFIKKTFFIEIYWKFIVSVCKCLPPVSPIELMITLIYFTHNILIKL